MWYPVLGCVVLAGCRGSATAPVGTGAERIARDYIEALARKDWPAAHALLHPDSRARCGVEVFARRAEQHRRGLGFEPKAVRLRSCEERGDQAIARFVFTGSVSGRQRVFREAIALRRGTEGWGVVLSPRFGQSP
jgi:hypothetical protein